MAGVGSLARFDEHSHGFNERDFVVVLYEGEHVTATVAPKAVEYLAVGIHVEARRSLASVERAIGYPVGHATSRCCWTLDAQTLR